MKKSKNHNLEWISKTILFVVVMIGLCILVTWKPLFGSVIALLLFLTVFVGSVLKAYTKYKYTQDKDPVQPMLLSEKEGKGSQRLLRYATAVLSFLSLITTANGMESFVFDTSWMAYCGSFAVQSILVVFSLLLCRFFVQVTVLSWPKHIKMIVNALMIVFFCVALLVSSIFSFTYIANNAYKDSWARDSEKIIQGYLLEEFAELQKENEKRGKSILNTINTTANDRLQGVLSKVEDNKKDTLKVSIDLKIQQASFESQDLTVADINKDEWLTAFPKYQLQIEFLYNSYEKSYIPIFKEQANVYHGLLNTFTQWKNSMPEVDEVLSETESMQQKIQTAVASLESAKTSIDSWQTSGQRVDHSAYKENYKLACDGLVQKFNTLSRVVDDLYESAKEWDKLENERSIDELNDVLSQIYLLGVDTKIEMSDLVERINSFAIKASSNENYSNEDIKNIIALKDALVSYKKYVELREDLSDFSSKRLQITYQILNKDKDKMTEESQQSTEDQTEYVVSEEQWRDVRNADFNRLYTFIVSLPDASGNAIGSRDVSDVMEEASNLQRDLLGDITSFEQAFIYFKYRFPVMAFFSLAIAVFFDLGAFFTGCFLYATEYFTFRKEDGPDNKNPKNPNDVD